MPNPVSKNTESLIVEALGMTVEELAVTLGALALIMVLVWYFFGPKKAKAAEVKGLHRYWKSGFTKEISDDLIDVIVAAAEDFSSPMSAMLFFRIHGAATRVSPDESAFGLRGEQWDFNVIGQWADETESARHTAWVREQWGRIEPLISGSAYINHIAGDDLPEKIRASFGPSYDKLVGLKNKYDPKNMLRLNPNLKPTV